MKLVVISGRSGSGKTTALHVLEDIGYYCVDNLPVTLLRDLMSELATRTAPRIEEVAIGIDARNSVTQLEKLPNVLRELTADGIDSQVIYLDAGDEALIKRFSETRRRHPISNDTNTLKEAIVREREMLNPVASSASLIIDTSNLTLHELRDQIKMRVAENQDGMAILFQSFGFKNGIPTDADLVFDVRCLPNPHWISQLRSQSGLDQGVQEFLQGHQPVTEMVHDLTTFLETWLPRFAANNRSYMTVSIGCTGGQHRSVYVTEQLCQYFKTRLGNVQARHRDL
ncbi:RNase adapter RapZ [Ketobacter alkanivorans]|uniref:RNase adaptor protein RapZ n=1 Tax=Ketobacter alkanivorans TaxID=1917421 RepID=A0A2K9LPJ0_9GAMM|nr:RNase adapter RapZ [Ketobacter alkanivorans]AUM14051.1 RNase adaptor protein RapZ [Ketobacter alkanivorans]